MKVTPTHRRAVKGFRIDVAVQAESGETIVTVTTTFDAMLLETANPASESYNRSFDQVGGWTPGANHTTTVIAVDDKGKQHRALDSWTD